MSAPNLRLVPEPPPLPPGAKPAAEAAAPPTTEAQPPAPPLLELDDKTAVTSRRRVLLIAAGLGVVAAALFIAGLRQRPRPAPSPAGPATRTAPPAPALPRSEDRPATGLRTRAEANDAEQGAPAHRSRPERADVAPKTAAPEEAAPRAPRGEIAEAAREEAPAEPTHRSSPHHRERHHRSHHERRSASPASKHGHASRKAAAASDRHAAREAYKRGSSLLLMGNATDAAAAYAEAVRLAPAEPVGYRGLGLAYEKQGKRQEAISAFVSYLKLSHHARDREVIARRLYRLTHPEP